MGIDHYMENKSTLDWGKRFNIEIETFSISEWINIIEEAGFSDIYSEQFNKNSNSEGTLIIMGRKRD